MHTGKIRILIIDDEEDFCFFIKRTLELGTEFQVLIATTGKKGVLAAHLYKPRLILLDIMMPGISGLEVFKRLREDKETRSIPVVALTAKRSEFEERIVYLCCEDYIVKPVETEVLISRIEKVLSKSPRTNENERWRHTPFRTRARGDSRIKHDSAQRYIIH